MESVKKIVSSNKKYLFPSDCVRIYHKNKILIISPKCINWIVLDNEDQLLFFDLLKDMTLGDALKAFGGKYEDAQQCVIQIEAKHFEQRILLRDSESKSRLHLYLTNECNLRCKHCYMYSGKKDESEMTTSEVKELLDNFKNNLGDSVTFSGGEVSMRKDFLDILKYAKSLNLNILVLTNGIAWSDELIESTSQYIDKIQISVDGYSDASNAAIRGKNTYNKALSTVDRFIKKGVCTELGCTPIYSDDFRLNYLKYVTWAKDLLDKYADTNFRITFSGDLMDGRELHLSEEERKSMMSIVDEIYEKVYGETKEDMFISAIKNPSLNDNCTFGMLSIASNGDVYLCSRVPSLKKIGNIRDDSFELIASVSKKARVSSNVDNLLPCKKCDLRYICGGDCRVKYFDKLVDGTIENVSVDDLAVRQCHKDIKERYYDLMIKTNELFFQ